MTRSDASAVRRAVLLAAVAALATLAAPAAAADPTTIYVDDDWSGASGGDTVGDGYVVGTNATATIQEAMNLADAGDTVVVRDGTYDGQVVVDEDVTLTAESPHGATIRYAPGSATGQPAVKVTHDGATVSGFTVERVAAAGRGSSAPFAQGIRVSGSDVRIENNVVVGSGFTDLHNKGIMVLDDESGDATGETVANVTVTGNDVSGFAGPLAVAANYGGSVDGVDVSGNTLAGVNSNGISVGAISGTVSNVSLDGYGYEATTSAYPNTTVYFATESDALSFGATMPDAVVTDGQGTYLVGSGMSIQDAVNASGDGDTVSVAAGTYTEQVVIETNVSIVGAGEEATTIKSPSSLAHSFTTAGGEAGYAALVVENANADVRRLTVDGANNGDGNVEFHGIAYANASGTIANVTVENVMNSQFSGSQHGTAVAVYNLDGQQRTFTMKDSTLVDYQKGGFVASGSGLTARVIDNDVTGQGPTDVTAQNGIQISGSAVGIIKENTVSGHDYTPGNWLATDILLSGHSTNETTVVANNTLSNSMGALAVSGSTNVEVTGNNFSNNTWHLADYTGGLDTTTIFESNDFDTAAYAGNATGTTGASIVGTLSAAVSGASSGDTVHVANGYYDLGGDRVDVSKDGITIEGESKSGVVVDGSGASWPIYVHNQSDVTLRNLTVYGTEQSGSDDTIKAAFVDGLTIENVAVNGSAGNELDLNNVVNATLRNVDADGEGTGGVGVALSGVRNVTLDDVDTTGNGWGGVGLYDVSTSVKNNYPSGWTLVENTSEVTVAPSSDLNESISLYSDQAFGGTLGALYAPAYDYAVQNPDHRPRGDDFVFYTETESEAVSLARGLANNSSSTVRTLTHSAGDEVDLGSTYVVADGLSIQTAIDAADAGATVRVANGTYDESLTVDEPLSLVGAGAVVVNGSGGGDGISLAADDVVIRGVTVRNFNTGLDVASTQSVDGLRVADSRFANNTFGVYFAKKYDTPGDSTVSNVSFVDVTFADNDKKGLYVEKLEDAVFDGITVEDSGVDDTYQYNNGFDINLKAGDYENVTVRDSRFVGSGEFTSAVSGRDFSGALAIKARDDGDYNDSDTPAATLTGVTVVDNTFVAEDDSERVALRFGEPGAGNAGPTDVTVAGNTFTGYDVPVYDVTTGSGLDAAALVASNNFTGGVATVSGGSSVYGTIQAAVDHAAAGDTVRVSAGTFTESVVVDTSVTLEGAGAGRTVIAPESGTAVSIENVTSGDRIRVDDVTVRDLTVRAAPGEIGLHTVSNTDDDYETGNVTVEDAVVEGGVAAVGLFDTERATFENVTVRNVTSDVGAFEVGGVGSLVIEDSRVANTTTGVKFNDFTGLGYEPTGSLTVRRTTFTHTDVAVNVTAGIDAAAVTLQFNDFGTTGQSGGDAVAVANNGAGELNATLNYWGSANGPAADANRYNAGSQGAAVTGDVAFAPWLNASLTGAGTASTVSPVTNTDTGDSYASIQAAVDDAASGDTIHVAAGSYDESVAVDTANLTLVGADGATIHGGIGFTGAHPDGVTVTGFTFTDTEKAINANNAGDDLTVTNNRFVDVANPVIHGGESGGQDHVKTGWTIADNEVTNASTGFRLWNLGELTVTENDFTNVSGSAVSLISVDGAVVAQNTVTNSTKAGVFVEGPFSAVFDTATRDVDVVNNTFTNAGAANTTYPQAAVKIGSNLADRDEVEVHQNRITAFRTDGLFVADSANATGTVNATLNYWGAPTGPGGAGPGDGANVTANVTVSPFYVDAAMTTLSTEPPAVSNATLVDATDGNGVVGDGDRLTVSARVTDASGVDSVRVDAGPFGAGTVTLTDGDADGVYEATFTVDAAAASVDASYALSVVATDRGGAVGSASTNPVDLSTDSETTTTFSVSDATPLNTDVVDVTVTVRNVGNRSADRTVRLLVDGATVGTKAVTVPANTSRTVTFQHRFAVGAHAVTVNDSVNTLAAKTVVADRATNPQASVSITSPTAGATVSDGNVTLTYALRNADAGIAAVRYAVDGGATQSVTDLNRTAVNLTGLSDGSHTVTVRLVDNLGNAMPPKTRTFTVDSTPPTVDVTPSRTDAVGANRGVAVDLSVTDANPGDATFVVRDAGGDAVYAADVGDELADGTATVRWDGTNATGDPVPSGTYTLALNASDAGGLTAEANATVAVDNAAPSVGVDSVSPLHLGGGGTVTVDVTAADAATGGSGVDAVDVTLVAEDVNYRTTRAATNGSGTWTATFDAANLTVDGNYTVRVTATDAAGNDAAAVGSDELAVDTSAPTVSAVVKPKDGTTGYVNVTVSEDVPSAPTLNLDDPDGNDVTVNGFSEVGSTNVYSGTFSFTGSGQYELNASAADAAGNAGKSTATANVSTALTGRQFTIRGGDGTVVVLNTSASVSNQYAAFTSSDTPLAELGTNVGSTFLNGELSPGLTANLDNASIRIPTAGNTPAGVDTEDVEIRRYNATTGSWEAVGTTEVRVIDGTEYFVATVEHFSTYGPVAPDTTAPSIDSTAVSPTSPTYSTATATVTVQYSDNKQVDAGNVTVRFDGADVTGSAATSVSGSQVTYTASGLVGSGTHWLNVSVPDTAGNAETENVSFTVPRDTDAPQVTESITDSHPYGTTSVPLSFGLTDSLSGVNVSAVTLSVDGVDVTGPATVTASGVQYTATGLGPGTHTATLTVADAAGNTDTVTESFVVAGDTDTPTVTSTTISPTPTNGELPMGTTQATVEFEYTDATSSIDASNVTVRLDGTDVTGDAVVTADGLTYTVLGLTNGSTHTVTATVVDAEGNTVTESVTVEVAAPATDSPSAPGNTADDDDDSPSTGPSTPTQVRVSDVLQGGVASVDLGTSVSRVDITFDDAGASGIVTVQQLDGRPASVPPLPDGARDVAFIDVTVPSGLTDSSATVRLTVNRDAVGTADPSGLVVYHYHDGSWSTLDTSLVSATDETVVLEARTPGFSLFAVGSTAEQQPTTDTPTDGETPTETPTDEPTETPADTPTDEPATSEPVQEPAGFDLGVVAAVLLLLVIVGAFVALRRRE
ncbi:right-handed parallel beta-helix repeat-containing protein [Halobaculum sp. D14]|uniref:right-handed parallel beta-helix repeat-containing protein n=1 Tax=Halobaculum sp. D14 TaxID=3421642 RepID=UPI003EBC91F7